MLTAILLTLAVILATKYLWDRWRLMTTLKRLGIPGPTPNLLVGNLSGVAGQGFHPFLDENTAKYGKIWGYMEGYRPTIVLADADMMQKIYIKEFSKFYSRKIQLSRFGPQYGNLFDSEDVNQWKRLRAIGSPSFSALRMKQMSPLVNNCITSLMDILEGHCKDGKAFNIHQYFQRLTLDVIACCAFGIDTNSLKDPSSIFLQKCRDVFGNAENMPVMGKLAMGSLLSFPVMSNFIGHNFLRRFPLFQVRQWFLDTAKEILETRKNSQSDRVDFIKLMLEAIEAKGEVKAEDLEMKAEDESEEKEEGEMEKTAERQGPIKINKQMTLEEMQANSFMMLAAGYETTSSTLALASHELALAPEIQRKLQTEIDEHFPEKDCRPNYITVHKMEYLDMFVNELIRLHTIAAWASTRHCHESVKIGDYNIPAGVQFQMNIEGVHMDPEHWGPEDVNTFVPERFLPERKSKRHPMAFIPFGGGPRNCIGMRFALMEAKIALVRILQKYNIHITEKTRVPTPKTIMIAKGPAEGIYVRLTRR